MGNDVGLGTIRAAVEVDSRTGEASLTSVADKFKKVGDAAEQSSAKVDRAEKLQNAAISRQLAQMERWVLSVDKNAAAQKRMADAQRLVQTLQSGGSANAEQLARALAVQAAAAKNVADATSHTIPQFAAASGAVRLLEGGMTNNVRAAERFLSTTLRLGPILSMAFPVVGALAFGAVLVRMGTRAYEFVSEIEQMPGKIRESFQESADASQLANDELKRSNDELDNQIAKLEHKPQNNLLAALDDDRIMADRLAESLDSAAKRRADLLKADAIGIGGNLLGKGSTGGVSGSVEYWDREIAAAGRAYQVAVLQSGASSPAAAAALTALQNRRKGALGWAQHMQSVLSMPTEPTKIDEFMSVATPWDVRHDPSTGKAYMGDQSANLAILSGVTRTWQQDAENLSLTLAARQKDKSKSALQDHNEGLPKLSTVTQQWEREFRTRQARQLMTLKDELDFWNERAATVKKGSAEYQAAIDKANDVRIAGARQAHEKLQQIIREAAHPAGGSSSGARGGPAGFMMGFGGTEGLFQSGNEALQAAQDKNSEAAAAIARSWVEAADKVRLFEGTTTPLAVAIHKQAVDAAMYSEQLKDLRDQLAKLQEQDALAAALGGDPALAAKEQALQTQIAQLEAKKGQSAMEDASSRRAQTVAGATINALNRLDQSFLNTADMVSGILVKSIGDFNDTLVKVMNTPSWQRPHAWDQLGASFFSSVEKAGLQQLEGHAMGALSHVPFLKKLGLGAAKADGSASNPFHVVVDGGGGPGGLGVGSLLSGGASSMFSGLFSGGSSGIGSLFSGLFGGAGSGASSAISTSLDNSVAGISIPMESLQGFANGGPVPSNIPVMVGERGPEVFMPSTPGHIVPNHQLRSMSGPTVHIDARGATDPAAVEASVHRAMISYMPAMQGMALAAVHDNRRRKANPWGA